MARTTKSKEKPALSFALDHVELVSHGASAFSPYCMFSPGWVTGYDGITSAGYRVANDINIAPHTETIRAAVARAGNPFSLTVMQASVVIRGDAVKVECPCFPPDGIPNVMPDYPRGQVSEALRDALVKVGKVSQTRSNHVISSAVFLTANACIGTDGGTILEAVHGCGLPETWLLPSEFINVLERVKYAVTHVGWSDNTFTLWFGNNCWVRANIYSERYPDTDIMFARLLSECKEWRPIPKAMLPALETLKPFLHDDTVTLFDQGFDTLPDGTGNRALFEHHMPPAPRTLPYVAMKFAATHGEWIAFTPEGFYWLSGDMRGITAAKQ